MRSRISRVMAALVVSLTLVGATVAFEASPASAEVWCCH